MKNPPQPVQELTPEELAAARERLADNLGYLIARAWLRYRQQQEPILGPRPIKTKPPIGESMGEESAENE